MEHIMLEYTVSQLRTVALNAFYLGNYSFAESKCTEIIALDPTNKKFRLLKADCLENLARLDDALREYDRVLELFPDCGEAWMCKANLLSRLRLFEEVVMCADNALRLNSKDVDAWDKKGVALEEQGKLDEAMECYEELIHLSFPKGYVNKGMLLLLEYCDVENAIICFDKALELDGENVTAWNGKGVASYCMGLYEEAVKCYDNVTLNSLWMQKEWRNAFKPNIIRNKGEALMFQGKYQEADQCFQISYSSMNVTTTASMGYLYLFQGRFQDALSCFEKTLVDETEKEFAVQGKALCEYLMANPRPPTCPNPIAESLQKLKIFSQIELSFFRGISLRIFGELDQATQAFEKCLELSLNFKAAAIEIDKIKLAMYW